MDNKVYIIDGIKLRS